MWSPACDEPGRVWAVAPRGRRRRRGEQRVDDRLVGSALPPPEWTPPATADKLQDSTGQHFIWCKLFTYLFHGKRISRYKVISDFPSIGYKIESKSISIIGVLNYWFLVQNLHKYNLQMF